VLKLTEGLIYVASVDFFGHLLSQSMEIRSVNFLSTFADLPSQVIKLADLDLGFEYTDYIFQVTHVSLLLKNLVNICAVCLALESVCHRCFVGF